MRSRLARVAILATAALLTVSTACKKGGATADVKVTPTAGPATAASTAASAAAAMELFKAMKLPTNIQDTAAAMIDSEVGRNPGLNPFRDTMLTWLKKYMTWDAMVPELTKLYTSTFTDDELKQMAAFYSSPAGQKSLEKFEGSNEDQTVGVRILHRAIEEPLRQIVDNAGEDAAVILNRVKEGKGSFGYNAASGKFGDMLDEGILDPTKVTRLALQNAASVAGLLLTTEVMVAEAPKDDEHAHGGGMPPGGMGGMDM